MCRLRTGSWPLIPLDDFGSTLATPCAHLYTQIVGKVRLANEPLINHWWNSPTLYEFVLSAASADWDRATLNEQRGTHS